MAKCLRKKIERMEKCKKADDEEKLYAKGILKDMNKHLNNEEHYHTNQQLMCYKDILRGAIVKNWIVGNSNLCEKKLIEHCVNYYNEFWNRRFVILHSPDMQKKVLIEDIWQ